MSSPQLSISLLRHVETLLEANPGIKADTLLARVSSHLEHIREARKTNPYLNVGLAETLVATSSIICEQLASFPLESRSWLVGAILYFLDDDDEIPDLESPIGLDDDCEVFNACLRFAGRADLVIDLESFDEL